ncbi:MAG TPA: MJ0042-type zinc finger domain-containing protein [Devosiaceae bacterium]
MIIACPHCDTRYDVSAETLGSAGRQVQCARCGKAWRATAESAVEELKVVGGVAIEMARPSAGRAKDAAVAPPNQGTPPPDDNLFSDVAEAALDAGFEAEEKRSVHNASSIPPATKVDMALIRKRRHAMMRRQKELARGLPSSRIRRTVRTVAITALVILIGGGLSLRTELVRVMPSLAGLYSAIGLGVNVIGLDFTDVRTLRARKDGKDVIEVSARIVNVAGRAVFVPPVLVDLFDAGGKPIYAWTVVPREHVVGPGESFDFSTQVTAPSGGVARARLTFSSTSNRDATAVGN